MSKTYTVAGCTECPLQERGLAHCNHPDAPVDPEQDSTFEWHVFGSSPPWCPLRTTKTTIKHREYQEVKKP